MARKQCKKCPWKMSTNPLEIPGSYDIEKHRSLEDSTIADPGNVLGSRGVMACHETTVGSELPCVGWLSHQIGIGENIGLRIACTTGIIDGDVETVGLQHQTFRDTLPLGFE